MKIATNETYNGFALFSRDNMPLGVISKDGNRLAICNNKTLPLKLKKYLIEIEDQRFYEHGAIDIRAISRALYQNLKAGKITQGGSTITQQLARNLLKDNRKNIYRKIKEISLSLDLENQYTKDQILELYFNNVFWGRNNYGVRAASLEYFSKEPESLSSKEQIALLTLLRGPNYYLKNNLLFEKRCDLLSQVLHNRNILSSNKFSKLKNTKIKFQASNMQVFRNACVPFISRNINNAKHSIITTLDNNLQHEVTDFIANSKYATSILAISKGKVIGVGSSNGTDYPFTFKSNVGSTLKPFIYTFLRENGIDSQEVFSTNSTNSIKWNVGEVHDIDKNFISLEEALRLSNNNSFVNAAYQVGIDKTLLSLASVLKKPVNNLVPSSILGATVDGITLYDLIQSYDRFFNYSANNCIKQECLSILNQIAIEKFNGEFRNSFLKTGTTNLNKERFAIVGYANSLFGFLRQGNEIDDYTKEGGFISSILGFLRNISRKVYKWE